MIERKWIAIAVLFVAFLILLNLGGCGSSGEGLFFYEGSSERFKTIESQFSYSVCIDTQTGVEYLVTNHGNITVLVDKDGKPYLANGWRDYE